MDHAHLSVLNGKPMVGCRLLMDLVLLYFFQVYLWRSCTVKCTGESGMLSLKLSGEAVFNTLEGWF